MARSWANTGYRVIGLGLVGAILIKFVFIMLPEDLPPLPPGWFVWQEPGSTQDLVMTNEGVYAGGSRGLYLLKEGDAATRIDIPGIQGTIFVNALLLDTNKVLWVGHTKGLSIRTSTGWQTLREVDGLPHHVIEGIAVTEDGFVWLGTAKGAVRVPMEEPWNRKRMKRVTTKEGLLHDTVRTIIQDTKGGLWFGNYAAPEGGLNRFKNGQWQYWTTKEGLPHPNVASLMLDNQGRLWAGCGLLNRGGAAIFSSTSETWKLDEMIPNNELAGAKVRSLYQDQRGLFWIGSENKGLTIRKRDKTIRILAPNKGLPGGEIMVIAEASDGAMWLGTRAGAVRIAPEAVVSLYAAGSAEKRLEVF